MASIYVAYSSQSNTALDTCNNRLFQAVIAVSHPFYQT